MLYIVVQGILVYVLYFLYKPKIRYTYERYLISWIVAIIVWVTFYTSIYLLRLEPEIDIYRVRMTYISWSFVLYFMLAFFYFYGIPAKDIYKKSYQIFHKLFILFLFVVGAWILFDGRIIEGVSHHLTNGTSYEIFGPWYVFLEASHILSIVWVIGVMIHKLRSLSGIHKTRFLYIVTGYLISVFFQTLFISILPAMDIWILAKEQIVFFLPFLAGILYSIHRYKFRRISFGVGRICIFIFSIIFSIFVVLALKNLLTFIDYGFLQFWNLSQDISLGDIIIWNAIFYLTHKYLQGQFQIYYDGSFVLQKQLILMQNKIPFLQTHNELVAFLHSQFLSKAHIRHIDIITWHNLRKVSELVKYFNHDGVHEFFLNDIVFISENKHKFSKEKILKQLDKDTYLYIPMYKKKREILGIFCVWRKPFGDYYRLSEIDMLQDFVSFLTWHLTYMNIYSKIHELNLTLDKKVDEKTIEYNNLINRQNEYISYVCHEFKNPLTNTIFISHDLEEKAREVLWDQDDVHGIREDITMLSDELKKISELSRHIFSTQQAELWKIKLYLKMVDIYDFLYWEVSVLQSTHPHVHFDIDMQPIWSHDIDEIQLRQVIQNLLGNALKFIPKKHGKIRVSLFAKSSWFQIVIEDNGKWFAGIGKQDIFDKYSTGDHNSSGLGMWLYLCKKIVELHKWEIHSSSSDKLWWARFIINI